MPLERTLEWDAAQRDAGDPAAARPAGWRSLAASDTGRAAGLAAATIVGNVVALAFTVVFARVLGASGYGSLAALVSAFIILMVPGSALQIAVAREVARDVAVGSSEAGAQVRPWLRRLGLTTLAVAAAAVPLRELIAGAVNVQEDWAAGAVPLTSMLWILLSVERGALQGFGDYRAVGWSIVGETVSRLLFALGLVGIGLGVTGAFLGSAFSLVAVAAVLAIRLRGYLPASHGSRRSARLRDLLSGAWAPVIGLTLVFVLQEVHLIVVKHEVSSDLAGSYAVAAVAAKAIIWVAVGLGLYLLPEASRRAKIGVDARPILASTLGLIAALTVPMLLIFALGGEPLLALVFGEDLTEASAALPWLGLAMTLLAWTYLSVQYLLALQRWRWIWFLAVAAVVEVTAVAGIGTDLKRIGMALFAVQLGCAAAMVALSFRTRWLASPPERQTTRG